MISAHFGETKVSAPARHAGLYSQRNLIANLRGHIGVEVTGQPNELAKRHFGNSRQLVWRQGSWAIWQTGVVMRAVTAIEGSLLASVARWGRVALLVIAFTVIVVDMTAIYLNADTALAASGQGESPRDELFRPSGSALANGMPLSASRSNLSRPDAERFGIREALNAELLNEDSDQPVLSGWLSIDPHQQILTEPASGSGSGPAPIALIATKHSK